MSKNASKDFKVVVSGFAKGVDKQALDSAIKYKGQSIIVLPQGITTFNSGFKTYYKQIVDGDVLVLSTFHPRAAWSAGLAMARNPIIYGLADEIYVAESSEKGGTWSGVVDGIKKGRRIFVRNPETAENNANLLLIQKGAIAVDFNGEEIDNGNYSDPTVPSINSNQAPVSTASLSEKLLNLLSGEPLSAKEILEKLQIKWSQKKLTDYLKKLNGIQVIKKGRYNLYGFNETPPQQTKLFN